MGGDSRTLYVILTANASAYRAAMRGAGSDTKAFGRDVDDAGRSLDNTSDAARRFSTELNSMSGRVGLLVDTLALVGPSLIPITAGAIPVITSLAAGLGAAAIGGGAVILAAMGMSDAFKALNDYALDPTAENLAEVQTALDGLAPAAAEFTLEAWRMRDAASDIQKAAANGFFPGATEGLLEIEEIFPRLADFMYEAGDVAGDLAERTGEAFSSEKGQEFLDFLQAELRPGMTAMYEIVANLGGAAVESWQAFDDINDDFLDSMVQKTEKLERSAAKLKESESFQGFIDYIREEGPEALETLGALGDMTVQLLQAVAPLGGPALDGIEFLARAVATIADSPLGTPLMAGFAAATLLNRSLMVTAGLMNKIGLTGAGGGPVGASVGGVFGAISHQGTRASATVSRLSTDVKSMRAEYGRLNPVLATTRSMLSGTTGAAQRTQAALRQTTRAAGGAAAPIAALGVLSTGAGESLGLTNTATMALVGQLAGPWGAAIGAGVGYLMDFAGAGDEVHATIRQVDKALGSSTTTFEQYAQSLNAGLDTTTRYIDQASDRVDGFWGYVGSSLTPSGLKQNLDVLFNGDNSALGKAIKAQSEYTEGQKDMELAGQVLAKRLGVVRSEVSNSNITMEQMNGALLKAQPAMQALGISTDDLVQGARDGSLTGLLDDITAYQTHADSARGRTETFANAVSDLGNDAISTADSAAALSTAIEALLAPEINAEAATDAWRNSLKELQKELRSDAGFKGYSEGAMKNREATREYVETSIERLSALAAKSETTEKDMAKAVAATRREFIESGMAAGFSRKEIEKRADELKLTPAMVRTVFDAAGLDASTLKARELREAYKKVPDRVKTDIAANGIPKTASDVDALVAKYKLTERQRTALLTLRDLASSDLQGVLEKLVKVDGKKATPEVLARTEGAKSKIDALIAYLNGVDGKVATTYLDTVIRTRGGTPVGTDSRQTRNANGSIRAYANGGFGAGGYYDRVPQLVPGGASILWGEPETGWEAYISGKPGMEARNVGVMKAAAQRLGYTVQPRDGGGSTRTVVVQQSAMPDKMVLSVGGREFTAYVRGEASQVARSTVDSAGHAQAASDRMRWS